MLKLNGPQWIFVIIFQVAYGAIVYGLTRAYYSPEFNAEAQMDAAVGNDPIGQYNQLMDDMLRKAGNDADEIARIADQLFAQKRYAAAAEAYRRLVSLRPRDVEIHNNLGLVLHYQGRSREAVEVLEEGVAIDPQYQRIWLTLGFVKSGAGDVGGAKLAFQRAVDIAPDSGIALEAKSMLERLGSQ